MDVALMSTSSASSMGSDEVTSPVMEIGSATEDEAFSLFFYFGTKIPWLCMPMFHVDYEFLHS